MEIKIKYISVIIIMIKKYLDQDKATINNFLNKNIKKINNFKTKREIGCYMSHSKLYNKILLDYDEEGIEYTIVLEDDFNIELDNFIEDVNKILETVSMRLLLSKLTN